MSVPFILVALVYAVTADNINPQLGRDLVLVSPTAGGVNAAPGSVVLGNLGNANANGSVPALTLDANGNFVGFTGNSQTLPSGTVLVQSPDSENSAEIIDCPCGCNVTTVRNIPRPSILNKDQRCSRVTTTQIVKGTTGRVTISSPTATIGKQSVICPCGCFISTPRGTNVTIFVDEVNCARDPAGSVDGVPNNCTCGCEGESAQGTTYKFGRAPSCQDLPSMAGGSTVIINNEPDLNGVPLGLFPFTNVRNAPFGGGFGFGGFPGGLNGIPGGWGGVRNGFFRRRRQLYF